jgi:endoglucanase
VLAKETLVTRAGPVLIAGPWAATHPGVVNPSYFSPRSYADLDRAVADPRWSALAASSRTVVAGLTGGGVALPPDWASVWGDPGTVSPIGSPGVPGGSGGGPAPSSSFDALRVPLRYAESCVAADRRLAASLWPLYRRAPGRGAYALDGSPAVTWRHAASLVAAAAAAHAAGDERDAAHLLEKAQAEDASHPTYYGAAWVALGRVVLTTAALGGCA